MHIFLIRHGESIANVGDNYIKRIPDHLVELTDLGKKQAGTIAKEAKVKELMLTHLWPEEKEKHYLKEAKKEFKKVILAKEGKIKNPLK